MEPPDECAEQRVEDLGRNGGYSAKAERPRRGVWCVRWPPGRGFRPSASTWRARADGEGRLRNPRGGGSDRTPAEACWSDVEGLVDVLDYVVDVLDADGQPYHLG